MFEERYEQTLVDLLTEADAISFGDYTLKSGRESPFFIHAGAFDNGRELRILAECYAAAIRHKFYRTHYDVLFGPAFKGIALASAVAMATDATYSDVVRYCSNRDQKDHSECGDVLGSELRDGDNVIIIDDVLTSGQSIYETVNFLDRHADVRIVGAIVAIDRCEKSDIDPKVLARKQIEIDCGFPVESMITMPNLVRHLHDSNIINEVTAMKIAQYYDYYEPTMQIPKPTRNV